MLRPHRRLIGNSPPPVGASYSCKSAVKSRVVRSSHLIFSFTDREDPSHYGAERSQRYSIHACTRHRSTRCTDPQRLYLPFYHYAIWGMLPLYFYLMASSSALEIVLSRVIFSLAFCAVLLPISG